MSPQEVLEFAKKNDAKQLDLRFTDIPSLQHHVSYPISELELEQLRRRLRHGWIEYPRLGGDPRERHAADSRSQHGVHGSLRRDPHAGDVRRRQGPHHQAALRARPALDRPEGRAVPEEQRHRRHAVLRRRSRVLHLRQRQLRSEPALRLLLHRRRGRALEFGPPGEQPGLPPALQGRLLPGAAHRPLSGSAQRDGADHDQVRPEHRVPPSRSRHRRPVRNRSALRHAGEIGRQHDAVQVHHPQRGQPVRQDRDVHAQAALRGQRQRHAHATRACGRTASRCSRATATRASARWRCTTSAAC